MAGHLNDMLPNSLFWHLQGDYKQIFTKWLNIYQMIGARSEMVYTFIRWLEYGTECFACLPGDRNMLLKGLVIYYVVEISF